MLWYYCLASGMQAGVFLIVQEPFPSWFCKSTPYRFYCKRIAPSHRFGVVRYLWSSIDILLLLWNVFCKRGTLFSWLSCSHHQLFRWNVDEGSLLKSKFIISYRACAECFGREAIQEICWHAKPPSCLQHHILNSASEPHETLSQVAVIYNLQLKFHILESCFRGTSSNLVSDFQWEVSDFVENCFKNLIRLICEIRKWVFLSF